MIALILAAGYGTRMYPLTKDTPKALLPLPGSTILGRLLEKLENPKLKTDRIVLVSNHKFAGHFERWFGEAKCTIPWTVLDDGTTSDEDRLGSVGDLAFAIQKEGISEDLLVLGSDNLFHDPLVDLLESARTHGVITLGAYTLPEMRLASQYGVLVADAKNRITEFQEKPKQPTSSLISTAVYFFPGKALPLVLEYTSLQESADTLGSFISWLITRERVDLYRFRGSWFDIGDMTAYKQAQESFSQ